MPNQERPVSIRISAEDGEDVSYDLLKLIYIFKRLNTLGKTRLTVYRNLKKIKAQRQYYQLSRGIKPRYGILSDIASEHRVQLHFWDQSRFGKVPEKIHTVIPNDDLPVVNIMSPYFNEPNDFNLGHLHLILDLQTFKKKIAQETQGNFWQCCEISGFVGCEEWGQIPHAWRSDNVDLTQEKLFIEYFGFGFQIFLAVRAARGHHMNFERIHKTRQPENKKYLSLEYIGKQWPEEKSIITINDQFILRPKDYFRILCCPREYCDYNTTRAFNLDRHIKTCSADTVVNYKQAILTDDNIRTWCIEQKAFPESFHPRHFVTFDIESVGTQMDLAISDFTILNSLQRVVSVSVTKNFGDLSNRTNVIVRKSQDEADYRKFIEDFVNHLLILSQEFQSTIPSSIESTITHWRSELEAFKNKERNYSFRQVKQFRQGINFLEGLRKLNVYGFNSQSYDLTVLFSGLLHFSKMKNYTFKVLKRGNQIMCLRLANLVFVDCINFTSGCSLDSFATMWGAQNSKSVFPYEKYQDIYQMSNDKCWPRMTDFKSSLRGSKFQYSQDDIKRIFDHVTKNINIDQAMFLWMTSPVQSIRSIDELCNYKFPVCLKTFADMWILFTNSLIDGKMKSMLDYLVYYNSLDTEVLADAFGNYVESFIKNFNLSPIGFVSLPGIAERVLWKMFDTSENKPYSFSDKYGFINKMLRENMAGGLSCVFKRHVEVNATDEIYNNCVYRAKNGEKFKQLIAYDANSEFYLERYYMRIILSIYQ